VTRCGEVPPLRLPTAGSGRDDRERRLDVRGSRLERKGRVMSGGAAANSLRHTPELSTLNLGGVLVPSTPVGMTEGTR
jgi:hypothetical protein